MHVSIYHLQDTERARARRLPVTKPQLLVGSDAKCDIQITDDATVSPRHMTIAVRARAGALVAEIFVTPLAGATMINNAIIADTSEAKLGDTIRIGNTILKFRPDSVVSTSPPPIADPAPRPGVNPIVGNPPMSLREPAPIPPGNPPPYAIAPGPPPPPPLALAAISYPVYSADPTEETFLQALRQHPQDAQSRMVYADWLEQRGNPMHAAFVRDVTNEIFDPKFLAESSYIWRAIVSRTSIEYCTSPACPTRWDKLAMTDDVRARHCAPCGRRVYFCENQAMLVELGRHQLPVALDAPMDRVVSYQIYTGGTQPITIGGNDRYDPGEAVDTIRDPED